MIRIRRPAWLAPRAEALPGNVWGEDVFRYLLTAEQRRSRRSGHPFVLTILNAMAESGEERYVLQSALPAVASAVRETDIVGWIDTPSVLGIIFTQLDSVRTHPNMSVVQVKLDRVLRERLGPRRTAAIAISSHIFTDPLETLLFEHAASVPEEAPVIQ
jgi:hypothetical protein